MSCRHDLAISTCKVCYPETGTIQPLDDGDSMDGPGAVARDGSRIPIPLPFHTNARESDTVSSRELKLQDENQALRIQVEMLKDRIEFLDSELEAAVACMSERDN